MWVRRSPPSLRHSWIWAGRTIRSVVFTGTNLHFWQREFSWGSNYIWFRLEPGEWWTTGFVRCNIGIVEWGKHTVAIQDKELISMKHKITEWAPKQRRFLLGQSWIGSEWEIYEVWTDQGRICRRVARLAVRNPRHCWRDESNKVMK